jgi:hypothetical protein
MDINSLKKVDLTIRVKNVKPDQFSSDKKKKSRPKYKEEKKKNQVDMRV